MTWSLVVSPVLRRDRLPSDISHRIESAEPFAVSAIERMLSPLSERAADYWPHAAAYHAAALGALRLSELPIQDAPQGAELRPATASEIEGLSVAPSDSFLWLAFYASGRGRSPGLLNGALALSYEFGRHEGWIATRRNALAIYDFSTLSASLRTEALDEYARLVGSGFIGEAVEILTHQGWPIRDALLYRLITVPLHQRRTFARRVYDANADVIVPEIDLRPNRPWE